MFKRRIKPLVLIALASVLVTVCASQIIAVTMGDRWEGARMLDTLNLPTHSATVTGASGRWSTVLGWRPYPAPSPDERLPSHGHVIVPGWSRLRTLEGPFPARGNLPASREFEERAFGWPWRAMSWTAERPSSPTPGMSMWIVLDGLPSGNITAASQPIILPTRILWTGFAANTGLTFVALLAVISAGKAARAVFRRRRGCCSACGYDLRGQTELGCPECGAERVARSDAPESPRENVG
jgi:predicted RNA-binding Zn-ribbon protein involved in translation (DUF1610 family)